MVTYTLQRTSSADMETVFDVLTDHAGYADISGPRKVELEREGTPERNGVGCIRKIHLVGPPIREEVTVYDRPGRFAYRVLSGLPSHEQSGDVTLSHSGGGTHISYRLAIRPKLGPIGAVGARVTRVIVWSLLRDVVRAADKRSVG